MNDLLGKEKDSVNFTDKLKIKENMEKVRVKAVEKGIRGCEVYGDFINATLLIFTEIQEVLRAESKLSRDPRFSVGSLYPLDLAIEFPAAYW